VIPVGLGARRTGLVALEPVRDGVAARAWVAGAGLLGREPRGVPLAEPLPSFRRSLKPLRFGSVAPSESEPAPPMAESLRLSWSPVAMVREGWREYESMSVKTDVSEGLGKDDWICCRHRHLQ